MTLERKGDMSPSERAKEIACGVLGGGHDLLLACRDLAGLRGQLPEVVDEIMDTFAGVASEVDDLPIGIERAHWSAEALRAKDVEAAEYRERVRKVVEEALRKLLVALGPK